MPYGTLALDAISTSGNLAVTGNVSITGNLTVTGSSPGGAVTRSNLPAGCVLQVVQTVKSDTFVGAANGTEISITGLAATITPTSATSKILITAQIMYCSIDTTYGGWFKRNGTNIGLGDASGSRQRVTIGMAKVTDHNQTNTFIYNYLDSPSTTGAVTYQFFVNNDNAVNLFLNRSSNDQDNSTGKRGISTVTLMEIAG
jgi:hypothetical protein